MSKLSQKIKKELLSKTTEFPIGTLFKLKEDFADFDSKVSKFYAITRVNMFIGIDPKEDKIDYNFEDLETRFKDYCLDEDELKDAIKTGKLEVVKDITLVKYRVKYHDIILNEDDEDCVLVPENKKVTKAYFKKRICDNYYIDEEDAEKGLIHNLKQDEFKVLSFEKEDL